MKSITFTVQIQADLTERDLGKKATALKLCDHINSILAIYDGPTGGAQIIPALKNIKITTAPED